ncbi:hypothetical protein E2C01_026775 [Portunus trituberculatus]|uniref:Uncharacterized protein n=1 Tax=Portunus trituberculatus TaxID=210409 RepID=A0A5B7EJ32_PORTR|nr:hypothetical protein [Portunus trituberculatus]
MDGWDNKAKCMKLERNVKLTAEVAMFPRNMVFSADFEGKNGTSPFSIMKASREVWEWYATRGEP